MKKIKVITTRKSATHELDVCPRKKKITKICSHTYIHGLKSGITGILWPQNEPSVINYPRGFVPFCNTFWSLVTKLVLCLCWQLYTFFYQSFWLWMIFKHHCDRSLLIRQMSILRLHHFSIKRDLHPRFRSNLQLKCAKMSDRMQLCDLTILWFIVWLCEDSLFCICWQQSEFVVLCIRLCIFVLCRKQSGNMDVCIPIGIFVFGGNSRWIVGGGTLPVLQWGRGGLQVRSGSSLPSEFSWKYLKPDDTVLQKYREIQ